MIYGKRTPFFPQQRRFKNQLICMISDLEVLIFFSPFFISVIFFWNSGYFVHFCDRNCGFCLFNCAFYWFLWCVCELFWVTLQVYWRCVHKFDIGLVLWCGFGILSLKLRDYNPKALFLCFCFLRRKYECNFFGIRFGKEVCLFYQNKLWTAMPLKNCLLKV